ncbi:unnamed protein product [Cochlearia groenlandica]
MALHRDHEPDHFMNLREWDRKARLIRENPSSRRFSASYVGSFREDQHKFSSRTYFNNISSTASSPGYTLKEEIDPSTYSFTNALKALQTKTMLNNREWLRQEGFALNSKWNEAEKYICNPLSGEVPMECLSSKTLSARSFRNLTNMSSPLHFPSSNHLLVNIGQHKSNYNNNNNPNVRVVHEDLYAPDLLLVKEEKKVVGMKRDVGIQSTPVVISSGSPSPVKTPPISERSINRHVEADDSLVDFNLTLEGQQELEEKQDISEEEEKEEEKKKKRGSGCFTWVRSRQRRSRKSKYIFPICVPHLVKGC